MRVRWTALSRLLLASTLALILGLFAGRIATVALSFHSNGWTATWLEIGSWPQPEPEPVVNAGNHAFT